MPPSSCPALCRNKASLVPSRARILNCIPRAIEPKQLVACVTTHGIAISHPHLSSLLHTQPPSPRQPQINAPPSPLSPISSSSHLLIPTACTACPEGLHVLPTPLTPTPEAHNPSPPGQSPQEHSHQFPDCSAHGSQEQHATPVHPPPAPSTVGLPKHQSMRPPHPRTKCPQEHPHPKEDPRPDRIEPFAAET